MSRRKRASLARGNTDAYFRSRRPPKPLDCVVGDRVAYTRYFLRQTAAGPTDPAWRRRGTVESLHPNGKWVSVRWDDEPDEPRLIGRSALARPGANRRFAD